MDGQSLDATVDKVLAAFQVGFTKWVEDVYTELAADNNMTLDELLAYCEVDSLEALFEMDNSVSIEDFLATYFPKDQFIAIIDSVSSNGTYTVEDGVVKLTIASETRPLYTTARPTPSPWTARVSPTATWCSTAQPERHKWHKYNNSNRA